MLLSVLYRIAVLFSGLIVQQKILATFGSTINGLTSSVTQLLSFLTLLEAGIGASAIQALHSPLANEDDEKASSVLSAGRRLYTQTGLWFLLGLILLSVALPIIMQGQLEITVVASVTLVSGLGTVLSYVFIGKYNVLLISDCRSGIIYASDTVLTLLSCIVKLLLVASAHDNLEYVTIVAIQAVPIPIAFLKYLILKIYVKKHYPKLNFNSVSDNTFTENRRANLVHQIAGIIASHTDIAILTAIGTLASVSLYSVYNYIYSSIYTLLETAFNRAILGYFGKLAVGDRETYNKSYRYFEAIFNAILYCVLTLALILTPSFIALYTKDVTDMSYEDDILAMLFFIVTLFNLIRLPAIVTVTAYGHFKQTQKSAVLECVINLISSVIFFKLWGIYGLLLGTLCAYLFRTQDIIRYTYQMCNMKYRQLIFSNIGNIIASAFVIALVYICPLPIIDGWLKWILIAIIKGVCCVVIFALANIIANRKLWSELIRERKLKIQ